MSSSNLFTVTGVFASRPDAERARKSLSAHGIPDSRIAVVAPDQSGDVGLAEMRVLAPYSKTQVQSLTREVEDGRTLVIVEADAPGSEIISILGSNGALLVETADPGRTEATHQTMPLYEEQLRIDKETREIGEVVIRKTVEEVPAQAEAETFHEELDVEHVHVGEVVNERRGPWREGEVLVVPVYEEQLTVVRKLVMREQLRITLHEVNERHTIADTVRREHAVVEDADQTRRVRVRDRGSEVPPTGQHETSEQSER